MTAVLDALDTPLGVREIAQLLEVRAGTVAQWKHRGRLPAPDWQLACGPLWARATVEKWARATNRWPERHGARTREATGRSNKSPAKEHL